VEGAFENDKPATVKRVLEDNNLNQIDEVAGVVARAIYVESPDDAQRFVERLPKDKQVAALWQFNEIVDRQAYGDAEDRIRSPQFVAEWMLRFPENVWAENIDTVLYAWQQRDREAFFTWLERLPADMQTSVASHYKPSLDAGEVENEFAAVMTVSNVRLRDQLLEQISRGSGARTDVVAALEKLPIPTPQKAALVQFVRSTEYRNVESDDD